MVGIIHFLGVELVAEKVAVHFEGERHGVGQADARTDPVSADGRDEMLVPKMSEILFGVNCGDFLRTVVETIGHAASHYEEGTEHAAVIVPAEQVRQVEGKLGLALAVAELVDLEGRYDISLALPAGGAEAQTDDGGELIAERDGSGWGEKILEGGFTDGVGGASLDLAIPVGVELQAGIGLALLRHCELGEKRSSESQE